MSLLYFLTLELDPLFSNTCLFYMVIRGPLSFYFSDPLPPFLPELLPSIAFWFLLPASPLFTCDLFASLHYPLISPTRRKRLINPLSTCALTHKHTHTDTHTHAHTHTHTHAHAHTNKLTQSQIHTMLQAHWSSSPFLSKVEHTHTHKRTHSNWAKHKQICIHKDIHALITHSYTHKSWNGHTNIIKNIFAFLTSN